MTFEVGENVLCYHGPMLYEAKVTIVPFTRYLIKVIKIISAEKDEDGTRYLVHYKGWKEK